MISTKEMIAFLENEIQIEKDRHDEMLREEDEPEMIAEAYQRYAAFIAIRSALETITPLHQTISSQKQTLDALAKKADVLAEALSPLAKIASLVPQSLKGASLWSRQSNFGDNFSLEVYDAFNAKQALAAYRGENHE